MRKSRLGKALDYLPLVAYLLFWLEGGYICSLMTRDSGLMMLPFVTLPTLVLMLFALARVGELHKKQ